MTLLLTANRATAEYVLARIRKEYGSVEKFFKKEWRLTDRDLANLRKNLIYRY
ncbi:MAG: tyrosine-protein phosphatase [Bacteroidales bacterium]